jgi:hypothetical protein
MVAAKASSFTEMLFLLFLGQWGFAKLFGALVCPVSIALASATDHGYSIGGFKGDC